MSTKAEIKTAVTGNIEMDYAVFGEGKEVFVILPGLSLKKVTPSAKSLARQYESFTKKYTVYVFDRRNNPKPEYTVRNMAEDTVKVMKSIGIEKADIFGASQGGMMAQCIAIYHPELVNRLVLASTLPQTNERAKAVTENWVRLAKEGKTQELAENMADNIYSENTLKKLCSVIIALNKNTNTEELEKFIINASACKDFDCTEELTKIKCPLLVIGSKGDKTVTPEGSEIIAEKLGCELYMYDDSYGHAVYDEAPDFKDRVLSFLLK